MSEKEQDSAAMERISVALRNMPYGGTAGFRPVHDLEDVAWNLERMRETMEFFGPEATKIRAERDEMARDIEGFGRILNRAMEIKK